MPPWAARVSRCWATAGTLTPQLEQPAATSHSTVFCPRRSSRVWVLPSRRVNGAEESRAELAAAEPAEGPAEGPQQPTN